MSFYTAKTINQTAEESCDIGEGLERSYSKEYEVILNLENGASADITPLQVYLNIVGLPQYGDYWLSRDGTEKDEYALMRKFSGKRSRDNRAKFVMTFNYKTIGAKEAQRKQKQKPNESTIDTLYPVWDITFEDRMIPPLLNPNINVPIDFDGHLIRNTAGDIFDPPPLLNDFIMVLNYSNYIQPDYQPLLDQTNVKFIDGGKTLLNGWKYKYCTNTDPFLLNGVWAGGDINKWLVADYKVVPEILGGLRVLRRNIVLKFSWNGWDDKVLDAGFYELNDVTPGPPPIVTVSEGWPLGVDPPVLPNQPAMTTANRKKIMDPKTGLLVTKPWPLKNGKAIHDFNATPVNYLSFRLKRKVAFAGLNVVLY